MCLNELKYKKCLQEPDIQQTHVQTEWVFIQEVKERKRDCNQHPI